MLTHNCHGMCTHTHTRTHSCAQAPPHCRKSSLVCMHSHTYTCVQANTHTHTTTHSHTLKFPWEGPYVKITGNTEFVASPSCCFVNREKGGRGAGELMVQWGGRDDSIIAYHFPITGLSVSVTSMRVRTHTHTHTHTHIYTHKHTHFMKKEHVAIK